MNNENFAELLESIKEGAEILNNRISPSRKFELNSNEIKELRLKYSLSQDKFAEHLGISVGTLKNWEQGRRKPTGPASKLLKFVEQYPELIFKNI